MPGPARSRAGPCGFVALPQLPRTTRRIARYLHHLQSLIRGPILQREARLGTAAGRWKRSAAASAWSAREPPNIGLPRSTRGWLALRIPAGSSGTDLKAASIHWMVWKSRSSRSSKWPIFAISLWGEPPLTRYCATRLPAGLTCCCKLSMSSKSSSRAYRDRKPAPAAAA